MNIEEKDGRLYFIIIVVIAILMVVAGLVFLLAPEAIEYLLYGDKFSTMNDVNNNIIGL